MTALAAYQVLEATGDFVAAEGAPPVEVLVKFGDASLTIMRFDETPLAHWPLATLRFAAEGDALTVAPDAGAPERLTVADRDMVAALRAVATGKGAAVAAPRRRRRGRIAALLTLAAVAGTTALVVWRPPAIMDRVAAIAPVSAKAALGEAAIAAYAGPWLCAPDAEARRALDAFAARVSPGGAAEGPVAIRLADMGGQRAAAVAAPGGRILAFRRAVNAGPSAFAEAVAVALARAERRYPTTDALRAAGARGLLVALSGDLGGAKLTEAAVAGLANPQITPDDAVAAALALERAGLGVGAEPFTPAEWRAIRRACGP